MKGSSTHSLQHCNTALSTSTVSEKQTCLIFILFDQLPHGSGFILESLDRVWQAGQRFQRLVCGPKGVLRSAEQFKMKVFKSISWVKLIKTIIVVVVVVTHTHTHIYLFIYAIFSTFLVCRLISLKTNSTTTAVGGSSFPSTTAGDVVGGRWFLSEYCFVAIFHLFINL